MAGGEIHQFALDAADVAQAQHRAPGDRAAFRLERAAGAGGERHHEAAALAAQRLDRALHALRRRRLQPGAEGEHALRHSARHHDTGIAEDFRLVAAGGPGHQHLRLRQQQRLEPVDVGAQRHAFVLRRAGERGGAAPRAQQHDDGEHREEKQPEGQGEFAKLLARSPRSRRRRPAAPNAGVASALQSVAEIKAARNPPRRGRERSLSFAVRIVSGITTCPRDACGVRRATRESQDFTPVGSRAERVQIVNGSRIDRANAVLFAQT